MKLNYILYNDKENIFGNSHSGEFSYFFFILLGINKTRRVNYARNRCGIQNAVNQLGSLDITEMIGLEASIKAKNMQL